jgi:6,7-dimethyl-8-ribityllumazine synthase
MPYLQMTLDKRTKVARYDDILELDSDFNGSGLRVGVVMSRFNLDPSEGLLSYCVEELRKRGVASENVLIVTVPGVLEIPLVLYKMAAACRFDALVALGAVIRGETYHFQVVANECTAGIAAVQRDTQVPVANAVIITDDDDQAIARMHAKGADAARTAIEMANLLRQLDGHTRSASQPGTAIGAAITQQRFGISGT